MTEMPEPTRYGERDLARALPDVLIEGIPDQAPGPDARYEAKEAIALAFIVGLQHLPPQQRAVLVLRDVLGFRAGGGRRRCWTPPRRRSTACCGVRAGGVRGAPARRRTRAGAAPELQARARHRRPLRRSHPDRRHRRRRRAAHRRRLADDAARARRVSGPRRDRRVPARPQRTARRASRSCRRAPTRSPRSAATSRAQDRDRARVRAARPHAGGRPHIRDHVVRRQRASSRISGCRGSCGSWPGSGRSPVVRAGRSRRLAVLVAPNAGACADERAAVRAGPHRLVQRAAAHQLAPGQEPHVQPLSQTPARGLPVIVTGSPGTAIL